MRERVQNIRQHQFLMLLFMIEAGFDQRHELRQHFVVRVVEEFNDRGIDVPAIGGDLLGTRPRDVAALGAGISRAGADVIGVEQEGVIGMERHVAGTVLAEQELLPEPRGMGAVPFRRTGVRHRLHHLIFWRERLRASLRFAPNGEKCLRQSAGQRSGTGK